MCIKQFKHLTAVINAKVNKVTERDTHTHQLLEHWCADCVDIFCLFSVYHAAGFTFWLTHVVEHPGSSFVQDVLQKHHLAGPSLHAPHQTEGHMPTPAASNYIVYCSYVCKILIIDVSKLQQQQWVFRSRMKSDVTN